MNRKHKTLKWGIALVSSMLTLNLSAQSSLIDYQSDKVDLGMGVEQSQMLTTASVEVVSGDELQKTAAISLKEALYGKLLGLTVTVLDISGRTLSGQTLEALLASVRRAIVFSQN